MEYPTYLIHYGIPGQKWGVRRWQSPDGSLTEEGIYRYRAQKAARTKKSMDALYNTLSKNDKKLLGDDENNKEWLKIEEGEYVVKRFLKEYGDVPIAALDIMTTTKPGSLTIAIMTDPKYRGKGEAGKLVDKAVDWYSKNGEKMGFNNLGWGAYADNTASRHLAERAGFKYSKKKSSEDWAAYDMYIRDLNKKKKQNSSK